jgi:hypothetical protein
MAKYDYQYEENFVAKTIYPTTGSTIGEAKIKLYSGNQKQVIIVFLTLLMVCP